MMSKNIDESKKRYYEVIRLLTVACQKRARAEDSCCPANYPNPNAEEIAQLKEVQKTIKSKLLPEMMSIEKDVEDAFGVMRLLNGHEPGQDARICLALLCSKATIGSVDIHLRTIGDLVEASVGRTNGPDAIALRETILTTLSPYLSLDSRRNANAGDIRVDIGESSYRVLLGLKQSAIYKAKAIIRMSETEKADKHDK